MQAQEKGCGGLKHEFQHVLTRHLNAKPSALVLCLRHPSIVENSKDDAVFIFVTACAVRRGRNMIHQT